jgi:hypothetical protein
VIKRLSANAKRDAHFIVVIRNLLADKADIVDGLTPTSSPKDPFVLSLQWLRF